MKTIKIETAYEDHDYPETVIIHARDGETYIISKEDIRKLEDMTQKMTKGHRIAGRVKCADGFYYRVKDGVCQGCKKKLRVAAKK